MERAPAGTGWLTAAWPDGTRLGLDAVAGRSGWRLQCRVTPAREVTVDAIGVRLRCDGADRLLVDGYHSWDWAGLREQHHAGVAWWGAIWGGAATPPVAVALDAPPRLGALWLAWEVPGQLDALCCGEPEQQAERSASARPLRRLLAAGRAAASDPLRLHPLHSDDRRGAGLPRSSSRPARQRLRGWLSWNCLGAQVTAAEVLAAAELVPEGGLVLLDDGWMPFWGDWYERAELGIGLPGLQAALARRRRSLGLWVAPFAVDQRAAAAAELAGLVLRDERGEPVVDRRPAAPQLVLDASRPAAREHLRRLGARLGAIGVQALKTDFLYEAALPGARARGWSGVQALRAGMRALVEGFRTTAAADSVVLACGAPAPPLVGLVDACRSGGDAVIGIPAANVPLPPRPWFIHGEARVRAQERNLAARAWLWGSTMPPDVDAVTFGAVGDTPPVDGALLERWLRLARRAAGPFLVSDLPHGLPGRRAHRLRSELSHQPGTAVPARPVDPLALAPTPAGDDHFHAWQESLPEHWDPR